MYTPSAGISRVATLYDEVWYNPAKCSTMREMSRSWSTKPEKLCVVVVTLHAKLDEVPACLGALS